jgi:hypothetical protein
MLAVRLGAGREGNGDCESGQYILYAQFHSPKCLSGDAVVCPSPLSSLHVCILATVLDNHVYLLLSSNILLCTEHT